MGCCICLSIIIINVPFNMALYDCISEMWGAFKIIMTSSSEYTLNIITCVTDKHLTKHCFLFANS